VLEQNFFSAQNIVLQHEVCSLARYFRAAAWKKSCWSKNTTFDSFGNHLGTTWYAQCFKTVTLVRPNCFFLHPLIWFHEVWHTVCQYSV